MHASGKLTLGEIEAIWDAELADGDKHYTPWMDHHLALYTASLDAYVSKFQQDGVKFLPVRWSGGRMEVFYSIIVHVPHTQVPLTFTPRSPPHPN